MKFSDIKVEQWEEVKPYFDTCLLPLTGLTGEEEPWQVTKSLTKLADIMEHVEIPFRGRVVTYPSIQYIASNDNFEPYVNHICEKIKQSGFSFVIVITANTKISLMRFDRSDLFITLNHDVELTNDQLRSRISEQVKTLWDSSS